MYINLQLVVLIGLQFFCVSVELSELDKNLKTWSIISEDDLKLSPEDILENSKHDHAWSA